MISGNTRMGNGDVSVGLCRSGFYYVVGRSQGDSVMRSRLVP
jgi:hypothetical protein